MPGSPCRVTGEVTAVQGGPCSRRLAFSVPAAGSPRHRSLLRLSPAPSPESRVVFDSWLFSAVIKSSSACRLIPPPLPVSPTGWLPSGPAVRGCNASAAYLPLLPFVGAGFSQAHLLLAAVTAQPCGGTAVPPCPCDTSSE